MNYLLHILIMCEIYIILALAANLLAGYSGLLSLAPAAFYGTGAYLTALLILKYHLPFSLSLLAAVTGNLVISLPVIWFAIRLRHLFFSLATLAWQIILFSLLYNWTAVTKGPFGINQVPKPEIWGHVFASRGDIAALGGLITAFLLLFFILFNRSHIVRIMQGIRDDQLAMLTYGKSPGKYKAIAILLSSGAAAIAGGLFATYTGYIDPGSFTLDESILIISIVLIGGLGTIKGSVAGAVFYVLLPEILRYVNMPYAIAANIRMMIYAAILVLTVIFRPHGFFGKYKFERQP